MKQAQRQGQTLFVCKKKDTSVRQIRKSVNIPSSTVGYISKTWRTCAWEWKARRQSQKDSGRLDRIIASKIKKNSRGTAARISSEINENYKIQLSLQTIQNRTNKCGHRGSVIPFISSKNKTVRNKFAKERAQKASSFLRHVQETRSLTRLHLRI